MSVLGVLPFHHLLSLVDSSTCRLGSCLLSTRCSIPGISHGIVEPMSSTANVSSRSSTPVVGCVIVVVRGSTLVVDHVIVGSRFRQPSFQCHRYFLHSRCRFHCHFLPSVGGVALYHSFSAFVSSSCGASQSVLLFALLLVEVTHFDECP